MKVKTFKSTDLDKLETSGGEYTGNAIYITNAGGKFIAPNGTYNTGNIVKFTK
jgi:hypothetical protein